MKFKIVRTKGKPLVVDAEYYRHDNGALLFRNAARSAAEYPTLVCTVAAGQWVAVLTDGEVE